MNYDNVTIQHHGNSANPSAAVGSTLDPVHNEGVLPEILVKAQISCFGAYAYCGMDKGGMFSMQEESSSFCSSRWTTP
jgi:hypothetical protein